MHKILIIEDEINTAMPVKEALELCGYSADIARDGEAGLELFREKEYDLVLLDLKMPKMTGEEVLKKIREKDPYVYVIVYTNYGEFTEIKSLTNVGIDGYINKGPDAELQELLNMIQNKLNPLNDEMVKKLIDGIDDWPRV